MGDGLRHEHCCPWEIPPRPRGLQSIPPPPGFELKRSSVSLVPNGLPAAVSPSLTNTKGTQTQTANSTARRGAMGQPAPVGFKCPLCPGDTLTWYVCAALAQSAQPVGGERAEPGCASPCSCTCGLGSTLSLKAHFSSSCRCLNFAYLLPAASTQLNFSRAL